MSKQQLNQQVQHDAAAPDANAKDDIEGLPPYLFGQVMNLKPGDAEALTQLVKLYPPYAEKILATASPRVGLSTVKQAQAMMQPKAVGRSGSLGPVRPGGEFEIESSTGVVPQVHRAETEDVHMDELRGLEGDKPTQSLPAGVRAQVMAMKPREVRLLCDLLKQHPDLSDAILLLAREHLGPDAVAITLQMMHHPSAAPGGAGGPDGAEGPNGPQPATGGAPDAAASTATDGGQGKPAQDAAWVAGARAFNAAHASWVTKFIDTIKDRSFLGADGEIDPKKVADFQARQHIDADGRVGPHTIAAAQKFSDAHPAAQGLE